METESREAGGAQVVRFCEECNNLLVPTNKERVLEYKCIKSGCDYSLQIKSRQKDDNLVSSKVFSKEKTLIIDKDFVLDPTMPRCQEVCPVCFFDTAVFIVSTDIEDTVIELVYICANPGCGHSWRKDQAS